MPIADPDGYDGAPSGVAFDRNWPTTGATTTRARAPPDALRGPSAASEPEVAALGELIDDVRPTHLLDWREGDDGRIIYPESWQVQTPATDAPALAALAGRDDAHSAIAGYSPGPAGELAIANGTLIDTAYRDHGTQAFAVQIPDRRVEAAEFVKARDFALDLAAHAAQPTRTSATTRPTSSRTPSRCPTAARRPSRSTRAARSAPSACTGASPAARSTPRRCASTTGERYGAPGAIYHRLRGAVSGFAAGDDVQVWFEGGGERSDSFTFTAVVDTPGDVLVLAAEDYSGTHPGPVHPGPEYLSAYTDALRGLGISLRRLRRRRPRPQGPRRARRALALRRRRLVHGRRHLRARAGPARQHRHEPRCSARRSSPRATTSTTAASCSSAASRRSSAPGRS